MHALSPPSAARCALDYTAINFLVMIAVEMGTLRSNTSVTDNTGTLTSHTGSTIHTEEQSATVVENEGIVDPLPEKVAL